MTPATGEGHDIWTDEFDKVQADELARIDAWRRENLRSAVKRPTPGEPKVYDTVGLALSGGGIRSAAFCLGALQALDGASKIDKLDYLSTVSGGGYIGASCIAGMNQSGGVFPFTTGAGDLSDNHAVGHIRNYSNYLMPRGGLDAIKSVSVLLRGMMINVAIVLGFILVAAGVTRRMNPQQESFDKPDLFGLENIPGVEIIDQLKDFAFTKIVLLLSVPFFVVWAFVRSLEAQRSDVRDAGPFSGDIWRRLALLWCGLTALAFFFELQPVAIKSLFYTNYSIPLKIEDKIKCIDEAAQTLEKSATNKIKPLSLTESYLRLLASDPPALKNCALNAEQQLQLFTAPPGGADAPSATGWFFGKIASFVSSIATYLASITGALAFFSKYLGDIIKTKAGETTRTAQFARLASKAAIVLVSLALPVIIWVVYLHFTIWADIGFLYRPTWMQQLVGYSCGSVDVGLQPMEYRSWLEKMAHVPDSVGLLWPPEQPNTLDACRAFAKEIIPPKFDAINLIANAYLLLGGTFLFFSGILLKPNANSPHTLYRDRLSKTFLFSPQTNADSNSGKTVRTLSLNRVLLQDPDPLDALPFAALNPKYGPLHLINTALNIQGSRYANKRGRKADFFFFSPAWSGSRATGYVKTPELVKVEPSVNIETAMAVSGAAASSNMGTRTVFGIAPTLALLNVRLGYWMTNPRSMGGVEYKMRLRDSRMLYLPAEMFGLLDEISPNVYLTDGGHIENLGIYELLRRRCRLIIAIDAEADPYMNFRSFVEVQRFARIDLGVRIDVPWDKIREQARTLNAIFDRDDMTAARAHGPAAHVAVGTIDYGAGANGVLVYVKACMTGDENDYILNYKSRHAAFPHESTSDQFFSEEQFEVYRSLGNHALRKALNGEGHVEGLDKLAMYNAPPAGTTAQDMCDARRALFEKLLS